MPLEKLLAGIRRQAEEQAAQIIEQAEQEAARRTEAAQQSARKTAREYHAHQLGQCRRQTSQEISQARLDARKQVLKARQQILDGMLQEVATVLTQVDENQYREWMRRQLLEACRSGDETVIVSSNDRERLTDGWLKSLNGELRKKGLKGEVKLQFTGKDFSGGFILQHPQYEVVATFEEILRSEKSVIQGKIARVLFGEQVKG